MTFTPSRGGVLSARGLAVLGEAQGRLNIVQDAFSYWNQVTGHKVAGHRSERARSCPKNFSRPGVLRDTGAPSTSLRACFRLRSAVASLSSAQDDGFGQGGDPRILRPATTCDLWPVTCEPVPAPLHLLVLQCI